MEKEFGLWALDMTRGTILTVTAFPKPKARLIEAFKKHSTTSHFVEMGDLARKHNRLPAKDRSAFRRAHFGKE